MTLRKNTKKSRRKAFTKKSAKKPKTDCFLMFVYHGFGRFLARGVRKHHKTNIEK
jgi:hypothetical protein